MQLRLRVLHLSIVVAALEETRRLLVQYRDDILVKLQGRGSHLCRDRAFDGVAHGAGLGTAAGQQQALTGFENRADTHRYGQPGHRLFAAEKPNYIFQRLTIEQGLSQSAVNGILKDSRGFLWFGTKDGLNRYDGYNFKIFRSDPSRSGNLTDNLIYCLAEDTEGNLWIGTQAGGFNRYDRKTERFEAYKPDRDSSQAETAGEIRAICPSPDGKL